MPTTTTVGLTPREAWKHLQRVEQHRKAEQGAMALAECFGHLTRQMMAIEGEDTGWVNYEGKPVKEGPLSSEYLEAQKQRQRILDYLMGKQAEGTEGE